MTPDVDFAELFSSLSGLKVGVIGDVMLDTYWWGKVERISPEAPVPVVSLTSKNYRLGGAANVALNLKSFDTDVTMFSVTGDDEDGKLLFSKFKEEGIKITGLISSGDRITTNKLRIMSRNQQMLRLDSEITHDLNEAEENSLLRSVREYIEKEQPQVLIFEDYNKGVLTARIIETVIELCNSNGVITTVDPKYRNFFSYSGVTIFKPNLKEVKEALKLSSIEPSLEFLQQVHQTLSGKLMHKISLITLSENGIFYNDPENAHILPSHVRDISDVSGAGDTVIAVASLIYASTKNAELMAEIANIAGGLVCEEVGTVAISKTRLLHECQSLLR